MFEYRAKIIKVYDGDTVTAEIDLGFNVKVTEKIRLFGINAPEVRGPEREKGIKSRDALRQMILGKEVELRTIKDRKGKYGRYLGNILLANILINEWLIREGHAKRAEY